jgi:UDPglucose 6-dehydrogenase
MKFYKKGQIVGILGLSYKPDTDVVEESQGVLLAQKLLENKIPVVAFDPQVKEIEKIKLVDSLEECLEKSNTIIIATQWNQFKEIDWNKYSDKIVIDCWRMIDVSKYEQTTNKFIALGKYIL